jgi:lysine-N-methylase
MKLYAPSYYKKFQCIADKCEHSCCIGWEIDIDENTVRKYQHLNGGYGEVIKNSVSLKDTPHFKLGEYDRCPHLNGQGLCEIILHMGEGYLCDICREHPRFYNYTDVAEVGLGMSCPEAARLILSSPDYAVIEEIGEIHADADELLYNGRALRHEIYELLQDGELSYSVALGKIYEQYSIDAGEAGVWLQILDSMEYLNNGHKMLFMNYSSLLRPHGQESDEYLKRFLAYLIYRHCTEAFDREDFAQRLTFCLFCERLLASLICLEKARSLSEVAALASIISEEIEYSDENTLKLMSL